MDFKLVSSYKPQGDQGAAIRGAHARASMTASSIRCCSA